jgi:hypothetical protein
VESCSIRGWLICPASAGIEQTSWLRGCLKSPHLIIKTGQID